MIILLQGTTGPGGTTQPTQPEVLPLLAVAQVGIVVFLIAIIALIVILLIRTGVGRSTVAQGDRSWLDYGNFFVVALGLAAVIIGFLVILLFRPTDGAQALGFLTALFGAITGLVGTYFGIKASSDASQGAQALAKNAISSTAGTTSLTVNTVTPPKGEKSPVNTPITATFSEDLLPTSINKNTFQLKLTAPASTPIEGDVKYNSTTRTATFTPANTASPLKAEHYTATINTGVRSQAGNKLSHDFSWDFELE